MDRNDHAELQTTIELMKAEIRHISADVAEIKKIVTGLVPSREFEHLRKRVDENEKSLHRLKALQVYIAAIAAIVAPIMLLILGKLLESIIGA